MVDDAHRSVLDSELAYDNKRVEYFVSVVAGLFVVIVGNFADHGCIYVELEVDKYFILCKSNFIGLVCVHE